MKHFITTCLIAAATTLGSACSNWLDVQPYDQISEEQLFSSEEGFQKLLNGIYIELCSTELYGGSLGPEMIEVMGGAYEIGDDAVKWGNYPDLKRYDYASDYWRDRLDATWNKAYALILNCNKLLEALDGRESLFTAGHAAILRGEALALRALLHFDMLRLFGPIYSQHPEALSIPYYTSRTMNPEPRLAASEVIERVLEDLTRAREELANDPVITEGTLMSADPTGGSSFLRYRALRLNYYAVTALEARVELYAGHRSEAFARALEVIRAADKGIFPFVERAAVVGTDDPDRIFSTEVLFALSHSSRNQIFLDYFSPTRTTFVFKMEAALINQTIYGGGQTTGGYQDDYRNRAMWSTSGSNRYFYKYADMATTGAIENTMIPMLRLGEMYLIAAEAQSDNLANGTSYINMLRRYRGISTSLPSLTQELLIYEYIRELYGEGQLFYLYKRLNTTIIRSATASENTLPGSNVFVVPLPDSETDNIQ